MLCLILFYVFDVFRWVFSKPFFRFHYPCLYSIAFAFPKAYFFLSLSRKCMRVFFYVVFLLLSGLHSITKDLLLRFLILMGFFVFAL